MAMPTKNMTMHFDRSRSPRPEAQQGEMDKPLKDGPCDGFEAGRILSLHGTGVVDWICDRVARNGGRPRSKGNV